MASPLTYSASKIPINDILESKLLTYLDSTFDRDFKLAMYAHEKTRLDINTEYIKFKLLVDSYIMNKDISKKELVFVHPGKTFEESINLEISKPSNDALKNIVSIIGSCMYGSSQDERILEFCASDKFIERLNELTDLYDSGAWLDIMNDLYELAYLNQDNKDVLLGLIKSHKASIVNSDGAIHKSDTKEEVVPTGNNSPSTLKED